MLQEAHFSLDRCPHCNVALPNLACKAHFETWASDRSSRNLWAVYSCSVCGLCTMTMSPWSEDMLRPVLGIWPTPQVVDESVPLRAKQFLEQAISALHAPAGATMLAASSVDAMLKAKGLSEGKLYTRIKEAEKQNLITAEMAAWAHEVRLEANDQRHADEDADLPNEADARKCVEFVQALAQFLFVLPSRVARGRSL